MRKRARKTSREQSKATLEQISVDKRVAKTLGGPHAIRMILEKLADTRLSETLGGPAAIMRILEGVAAAIALRDGDLSDLRARDFPIRCSCGRFWTKETWPMLRFSGRGELGGDVHEHRECTCGSGIVATVVGQHAPERHWPRASVKAEMTVSSRR
jgi:hypothetical protein